MPRRVVSKRNRSRRGHTRKRGGSQTWAVVQYDDRSLSRDYQDLVNRNKHYCERHNYEHIFVNSAYEELPPYWRKVRCVQDKLLTGKYKAILWLDTDAGVAQLDKTLDSLLEPNYDFYMSGDVYGVPKDPHAFNTGVWIVMNTPTGKEIMESWMNTYDPNTWKKNNGKWLTTSGWSGSTYEQGSFREKVLPAFRDNIKILNTNFLQGIQHNVPGMFIYHRYNSRKNNVRKFINNNPYKGGSYFKDITIGILCWRSPRTIRNTLESYKKNGLLKIVHPFIYFQERSSDTDRLAEEYGIKDIIGTKENKGLLQAFIEMVNHVKTKYFIFAECDFELINDNKKVNDILNDCMKLMKEKNIKVIRLRDRKNPGKPLHSRKSFDMSDSELEKQDFTDYIAKPEMVHFFDNPEEKVSDVFTIVDKPQYNYRWYMCDYKHYHWSNVIYMAETKFLKDVVIPIVLESRETQNGKNGELLNTFEQIMWEKRDRLHGYTVASGEGLFKHNRIDDCLQWCGNTNTL